MNQRISITRLACAALAFGFAAAPAATRAAPVSKGEAIEIARSFAEHRWRATASNVLHGVDSGRVDVQTPDNGKAAADADGTRWAVDQENVGVPYKWGGFDTPAAFDAGVRAGRPAGDLYTAEKRRKADAAVSARAVGVDCSGFISRCWKLPQKYGTATLETICRPLRSTAELLPGDIMNAAGGHVILFAKWIGEDKTRALFYEANPYSKVRASEYDVVALAADGFQPLRYRQMRE